MLDQPSTAVVSDRHWSLECRTARGRAYVLVIAPVMALLPSIDETP